jgi:hypothetical protein
LSVKLPRPFSLSVPLLKYWDGQPVTYMCRRRVKAGENPATADGVYWAIAFEIVDEDAIAALKARGGRPRSVIPADKIRKATPPPVSQEATVSDDDID